jgi:hypothetical protein
VDKWASLRTVQAGERARRDARCVQGG